MLLLLSACLINQAGVDKRREELTDHDGDGVAQEDDCDDASVLIYPGAVEHCDGVDEDCDGVVDDDPEDQATWFIDADGDGYGVPEDSVQACEAPAAYTDVAGDCDDNDHTVSPGSAEVPYDEVDQDCSGADLIDVDGDGAIGVEAGGDDCDDTSADVHPGAAEGWHDVGVDNNCDRRLDDSVALSLADADVRIYPPESAGYFGARLVSVPDVDGDAVAEVVAAASYDNTNGAYGGAVYVIPSSAIPAAGGSVDVDAVATVIAADSPNQFFGSGVSVGVWDGEPVLFVDADGANGGAGAVWAFGADAWGTGTVSSASDAGVAVLRGDPGAGIGYDSVADQDVDGDGQDDLFVVGFGTGALYGLAGPSLSEHGLADTDWTFSTGSADELLFPYAIGDVDLDGYVDLAVTNWGATGDEVGTAVVPGGPDFSDASYEDRALLTIAPGARALPMTELPSGDRAITLLEGDATIFVEPSLGTRLDPLEGGDYRLTRPADDGAFTVGTPIVWLGGATSAMLLGSSGSVAGECDVWKTSELSVGSSTELQLRMLGAGTGDFACEGLAFGGDYNADGDLDILVGAPRADEAGMDRGMVYVQFAP